MSPTSADPEVPPAIRRWHELVADPGREALHALLADDVVFRSPAVHRPAEGRDATAAYLWAAVQVLGPTLRYERTWHGDHSTILEFHARLDDRDVHGIDMISWDEDDLITEFVVMARPLRGLEALIAAMGAALATG